MSPLLAARMAAALVKVQARLIEALPARCADSLHSLELIAEDAPSSSSTREALFRCLETIRRGGDLEAWIAAENLVCSFHFALLRDESDRAGGAS